VATEGHRDHPLPGRGCPASVNETLVGGATQQGPRWTGFCTTPWRSRTPTWPRPSSPVPLGHRGRVWV